VQYLFQDAYASLTPGRSIAALARETAPAGLDLAGLARGLRLEPAHLARTAAQLSGGERRRAALLRSLTVHPEVLILDEPTASLDAASAVEVMTNVLRLLDERPMACVLVTHDEDLAAAAAHRVLRLQEGRPC
jgi:peptide/nickel transport system ATP-binding protein